MPEHSRQCDDIRELLRVALEAIFDDEAIVRAGKQMALIRGYSLMDWPPHDDGRMNEARSVIEAALWGRSDD